LDEEDGEQKLKEVLSKITKKQNSDCLIKATKFDNNNSYRRIKNVKETLEVP